MKATTETLRQAASLLRSYAVGNLSPRITNPDHLLELKELADELEGVQPQEDGTLRAIAHAVGLKAPYLTSELVRAVEQIGLQHTALRESRDAWRETVQAAAQALDKAGAGKAPHTLLERIDLLVTERDALRDDVIKPCMDVVGLTDEHPYPSLAVKVSSVKAGADQLVQIMDMVGPCPTSVYDKVREIMQACNDAPRDREADRQQYPDAKFNEWLDTPVTENSEGTVWSLGVDVKSAWAGWHARPMAPTLPFGWSIADTGTSVELHGPDGDSQSYCPTIFHGQFLRAILNTAQRIRVGSEVNIAPGISAVLMDSGHWVIDAPEFSVQIKDRGRAHRMLQHIVEALTHDAR